MCQRILITGSTGFVGRSLIPRLISQNNKVLELTRDKKKSESYFGNSTNKFELNSNQNDLIEAVFKFQPDICIHLASYLTSSDQYEDAEKLIESNIKYLISILDCLKKSPPKLFINTGTFAEYFKPNSLSPAYLYAATKTASRYFLEYYSETYNFNQITIVPYTIYGKKDNNKKIIDIIYDSLESEKKLDLTLGNQILDFIHIDDVVNFYIEIVKKVEIIPNKKIYHLGTGRGTTLKELSNIIEKKSGKKAKINWGAKSYRIRDIMYAVANINDVNEILPTKMIELEEGVERYLNLKISK
ncbi:NAD-dependent epimerase/dehydratase family protein [Seonamhaeicola marinus]|uniref:NAD(P)-dependent oxidoreductase n=1 Tax=Seonamhaeicola marinus TaxID=1912246 RepID=A0A5D0HSP8_9FLAO|nr:NAD(P)-dependent oxidoreductase [Seonamhaeicola marinus]TYA74131.1 NAD(P)-dependent oxidoreductase [Seonamhaeicola marinus]